MIFAPNQLYFPIAGILIMIIADTLASIVGKRYEGSETDMDRETLFLKIYREALITVMKKDLWKTLFENIITINAKI